MSSYREVEASMFDDTSSESGLDSSRPNNTELDTGEMENATVDMEVDIGDNNDHSDTSINSHNSYNTNVDPGNYNASIDSDSYNASTNSDNHISNSSINANANANEQILTNYTTLAKRKAGDMTGVNDVTNPRGHKSPKKSIPTRIKKRVSHFVSAIPFSKTARNTRANRKIGPEPNIKTSNDANNKELKQQIEALAHENEELLTLLSAMDLNKTKQADAPTQTPSVATQTDNKTKEDILLAQTYKILQSRLPFGVENPLFLLLGGRVATMGSTGLLDINKTSSSYNYNNSSSLGGALSWANSPHWETEDCASAQELEDSVDEISRAIADIVTGYCDDFLNPLADLEVFRIMAITMFPHRYREAGTLGFVLRAACWEVLIDECFDPDEPGQLKNSPWVLLLRSLRREAEVNVSSGNPYASLQLARFHLFRHCVGRLVVAPNLGRHNHRHHHNHHCHDDEHVIRVTNRLVTLIRQFISRPDRVVIDELTASVKNQVVTKATRLAGQFFVSVYDIRRPTRKTDPMQSSALLAVAGVPQGNLFNPESMVVTRGWKSPHGGTNKLVDIVVDPFVVATGDGGGRGYGALQRQAEDGRRRKDEGEDERRAVGGGGGGGDGDGPSTSIPPGHGSDAVMFLIARASVTVEAKRFASKPGDKAVLAEVVRGSIGGYPKAPVGGWTF